MSYGTAIRIDRDPFIEAIEKTPLLPEEEQRRLLEQVSTGDKEVTDTLVTHNMKLALSRATQLWYKIANVSAINITFEDLLQAAAMGLQAAIERFDATKGFTLGTYAVAYIDKYMGLAINQIGRTIRIPDNKVSAMLTVQMMKTELEKNLGRTPTAAEISSLLGTKLTPEEVAQLIKLNDDSTVYSLDMVYDIQDGDDVALLDTIADESQMEENHSEKEEVVNFIRKEVNSFDDRSRRIMTLLLGLNGRTHTLSETADILYQEGYTNPQGNKLSKQYIGQVKDRKMQTLQIRFNKVFKKRKEI